MDNCYNFVTVTPTPQRLGLNEDRNKGSGDRAGKLTMLASHFFRHLIRVGTLTVVDAYGRIHRFAGAPGPSATGRLHAPALHRRLPLNPYLAAGEAYMDGTLTVEDGTIYDALDLACRNGAALDHYLFTRLHSRAK